MPTDKRQKTLLIATAAALVLLLGDRLVLTPLTNLWSEWDKRIQVSQENLAKFSAKRAQDMQERWDAMKKRSLSSDQSAAQLKVLSAVTNTWARGRLTGTSVKPHWLNEEKESKSRACEFRVTATGTLAGIGDFLFALETDSMPVRVEDVELTARDVKTGQLSLSVRFTGLVLQEDKS